MKSLTAAQTRHSRLLYAPPPPTPPPTPPKSLVIDVQRTRGPFRGILIRGIMILGSIMEASALGTSMKLYHDKSIHY